MEEKSLPELSARKCQDADLDFVYDLSIGNMKNYVDKYWGGWNDEMFRGGINMDNITIIEQDGERVAFFDMTEKGELMRLANIQVVKEFQGQGIGTAILSLVEEETVRRGLGKIGLKVFIDNPAVKFYLKNGYVEKKRNEDSIEMEKEIGQAA